MEKLPLMGKLGWEADNLGIENPDAIESRVGRHSGRVNSACERVENSGQDSTQMLAQHENSLNWPRCGSFGYAIRRYFRPRFLHSLTYPKYPKINIDNEKDSLL